MQILPSYSFIEGIMFANNLFAFTFGLLLMQILWQRALFQYITSVHYTFLLHFLWQYDFLQGMASFSYLSSVWVGEDKSSGCVVEYIYWI